MLIRTTTARTTTKVFGAVGFALGAITGLMGLLDALSKTGFTDASETAARIRDSVLLASISTVGLILAFVAGRRASSKVVMGGGGAILIATGVPLFFLGVPFPAVALIVGGLFSLAGALAGDE